MTEEERREELKARNAPSRRHFVINRYWMENTALPPLSLSRADFEWVKSRQQCLQSKTGDAISELHEILV